LHAVGQKFDVFTTDRPQVQHLCFLAPLEGFNEEMKDTAGVVGRVGLEVGATSGTMR